MSSHDPFPRRILPLPIEDYALLGDCHTAALTGRDGTIDWLCLPRFDSPACLAALLGTAEHGHWALHPAEPVLSVQRRYRDDTLILETTFTTQNGEVMLTECMPVEQEHRTLIRRVMAVRGQVHMRCSLRLRFDYGQTIPWVTKLPDGSGLCAIAGPDQVILRSTVPLQGRHLTTEAFFKLKEGQTETFVLQHALSHEPLPSALDTEAALAYTEQWWRNWCAHCTYKGPWREAVLRSLIVLKALTYAPTGGIIAAPTTSLPEDPGGIRNWDYRYCWLRDAALTLSAFISCGYHTEAQAWRNWLHRSIAGEASQIQIMYGLCGERSLREWTVESLPGYHKAYPVRIGNAAADQVQLDIYGIMAHVAQLGRAARLHNRHSAWALQTKVVNWLQHIWRQPDQGIWEVRGGPRQFVHSKVMAWFTFQVSLQDMERYGLPGPKESWTRTRDALHADICKNGFNKDLGSFVQFYGGDTLDAALLLLPRVGFLPYDDPRIQKTIAMIEKNLLRNGFLQRYKTYNNVDGLNSTEGAFLACTFWLADAYALTGRREEGVALFEKLLSLRNDVGLLAEEYDPQNNTQLGNFPQGFSHLALIHTALTLSA
ncbi:glycoside hydrolase family 15 protein [Acetobacter sp. P5B1]|uniref:glycoside hydrolase family 15 protein n=1 Tax=Acetobacter sp. P5B1 TaxID=2762620 RepID=UPI001C048D34|nr:glycoside hydrolase family 15 protein [Acetobacter sp. P5B1]